ncbi:membrane peptidoglycan carboxypeptidase [Actinocrispum wychmicini]|uniref:Membrane peptidoglycan carboxypeptidase n=2 Tax=Actinocrispum wychmicini TaxID=1213861 RepID=A0A4R2KDZ0_9PSEU|nr:membrane peptidoglycan carboxypeptidase [Actinocrispum wychmicini]
MGPPPGVPPHEMQTQMVRAPGNPAEQPTDMLSPLEGRNRAAAEPELLTHREFDDQYDDPDSAYNEPLESEAELRRKRRKKIWRRIRRTAYVFFALMLIGPIIAFFIMYQMVDVPNPAALAEKLSKTVAVQWADGSPFTTFAPGGRRTLVSYDQIPPDVLHAVYAAEDATFETNSGFDISGILRAVWKNITGNTGGGSTITQQYVKKATEDESPTLTRKATEVVKAYKMSNTMSKQDIITAYLNTIYFGRGANGIAEAAKAYFNKDLKDVTKVEAAVLAGVIQSPNRELKDASYPETRWNYVMDKMVDNKWATPEERRAAKFPTPIPIDSAQGSNTKLTPDQRLVWEAALRELDNAGITRDQIQRSGYTIKLTVDPAAQKMAGDAIDSVMNSQPEYLRQALVAVDPNTGRAIAYYGYNKENNGLDYASQSWQNPGSSFKPFDLVALLHQGKGLGEIYDGSTPRMFGSTKMSNSDGETCKVATQCTVAEAMKLSINTVFADIAFNTVGTGAVAKAAIEAGIPTNVPYNKKNVPLESSPDGGSKPNLNIAIGGDMYRARVVDMAGAYATFADGGIKRTPHLVAQVTDPSDNNKVVYDGDAEAAAKPAFNANDPGNNAMIARNVTESLLPIPASSKVPCADNRLCAGKTGTHGCPEVQGKSTRADNCAGWMVGYTPQISTAVWVGTDNNSPVKDKNGKAVYGSKLAGPIWQAFMNAYLKGKDKADFGPYQAIGKSVEDTQSSIAASRQQQQDSSQQQQSSVQQSSQPQQSSSSSSPPSSSKSHTTPPITLPGTGNPSGPGRGGGGGGGGGNNGDSGNSGG